MKCVEITRLEALVSVGSDVVAAAILVMEIEEVLVARMVCDGQICASWEKMDAFSEGISGTASITKSMSEEERASMDMLGVRRERTLSAWSCVKRCLETSFARSLSARGYFQSVWLIFHCMKNMIESSAL